MKKTFIATLLLAPLCCGHLIWASEEPTEEPTKDTKLTTNEWQQLMTRIRNQEEAAFTEFMNIVNERRCPGTAEELTAMLKIAAGMGNKQAQYLLAECYRRGVGVRQNSKVATAWEHLSANNR